MIICFINQLFLRRELAADLVTFATAPSVALFTVENNLSVKVLPPKIKASTTTRMTSMSGKAIIGEENQSKMSSNAAMPNSARAHVGIEVL